MYLKNIIIKNIGPIENLSVELPFKKNGDPKPIIFVGENGSGKTILQSQIIDGFYEIGTSLFDDIGIQTGLKRNYYKILGRVNLQTGKNNGFSLLKFTDNKNNTLEYFDKIGVVKKEDFIRSITDFTLSPDVSEGYQKVITVIDKAEKESLQKEWTEGVHFYQPAHRYEEPFWKNEPFKDFARFEDKKRFSGRLDKEIEIVSSTKENKAYLLDLVLDYEVQKRNTDTVTWENIKALLQKIKKRTDVRFGIGPRGGYRVSIVEENEDGSAKKQLLPSIDNLSLGESILLNLFINIIRHGDNPPKNTEQIRGIVAIDEIDVHLHTDLQNTVLPELIKLFPKIQFIITTHSPLFLLGMKKTFSEDGFEVRNMPTGEVITTERFSEFEDAYDILEETEKFEDEVKLQAKGDKKPILLLEGKTDKKIFEKAWEILNPTVDFPYCILDIKDGHNAKDIKFQLEKADAFQSDFVFGIFDFDEEGYNQWNGLKKQEFEEKSQILKSHKTKKYYALLLPCLEDNFKNSSLKEQVFNSDGESLKNKTVFSIEHMFYDFLKDEQKELFVKEALYGGSIIKFPDSKKNDFCDWVCNNGTKDDFKNFENIFKIIEKCLSSEGENALE